MRNITPRTLIESSLLLVLMFVIQIAPANAQRMRPSLPVPPDPTGCVVIDSLPFVISESGQYCLTGHLAYPAGHSAGITVVVDDVLIDCGGFSLDARAQGLSVSAYGIVAQGRNQVRVRNCGVHGFFYGIDATGRGNIVEASRFDSNRYIGINVGGSDSAIRGNIVTNTGGTTNPARSDVFAITAGDEGGIAITENIVAGVWFNPATASSGWTTGIYTWSAGGVIAGNQVMDLRPVGSGVARGIVVDANRRAVIRENQVIVSGATSSRIGISCAVPVAMVRDSDVLGASQGQSFSGCIDGGGNSYVH